MKQNESRYLPRWQTKPCKLWQQRWHGQEETKSVQIPPQYLLKWKLTYTKQKHGWGGYADRDTSIALYGEVGEQLNNRIYL